MKSKNITMPLNRLLIRKPLISEKATELAAESKYVFMVDPHANKDKHDPHEEKK